MKEIIIDDVNVAECEYADFKSSPIDCPINNGFCYEFNCYFKQLQQLKKENKSLQMLSCANCGEKYLSPDGAELYEKNVQLEQTLEEIRKYCEEQNLKADYTACEVLSIIDEVLNNV